MNKPTAFFAITTITASVIATYLGWTLHVERTRRDATNATAAEISIAAASHRQPSATVPSKPQPSRTHNAAAPPSLDTRIPPEPPSQDRAISRLRNRSSEAADLAYRRLQLQLKYPDAAAVLNLQADEAARFFDLLARQERNDATWEPSSEGSGKSTGRELQARWDANKAEQAALLGEARMADWNKYLTSLGARGELRELRMQLADSDYPIRRDQYEPLVALLAAEQVRHNTEREELRRAQSGTNTLPPEQVIKYMDRRMDLIEESLARRRSAAATILDTEQLKSYEAMLDLERLRSQVEFDSTVTVNAEAAAQAARGNAGDAR